MYISIKKLVIRMLLVCVVTSLPMLVFAQASECGKERKVSQGALDEATWNNLNDIFEDVGEEKYDEAYDKLQKLEKRARDDYLEAVVDQALGQVEWARSNYDSALSYFEKAVELDALPDLTHFSLMYQIAQLYYMQERFDEALDKLALWMCKVPQEKVTADAYVLKASIYSHKQDWNNVIPAIDTAISMSEEPKENWYQLKLATHYELAQFSKAAETLEILIQSWPDKKMYWIQLSQIYYKLELDAKALSVAALAYRREMLDKQSDILYLSNLYSNSEVPFKAARVLQKGIEDGFVESSRIHWTMVADSWYAAEEMEKALSAYEKAGLASDDGEIDLRRSYILVDLERWSEASIAIKAALDKGGFNDRKTGEAYVLQGMSEFHLGHYDKASTAWGRASKYPKVKKSAQQWMNHMREEKARKSS